MDASWTTHIRFPSGTELADRVAASAPVLNHMCDAFDSGQVKDGVQAFQTLLVDKMREADLLYEQRLHSKLCGCHPSNREGAGIAPIDVQELLWRIIEDGWSDIMVDAMASEIPPTAEGERWREFTERLQRQSDELLAEVDKCSLTIASSRGSHTTAAVQL